MKVAIYLRVSTEIQDYERQRHEIENYCSIHKHIIVHVFEEKVSGAVDTRIEFMKLKELTKKDVDAIIVWEFSRLGRKISTVINTVEEFASKGINIITLKENFVALDDNGKMTTNATIMMALYSTMAVIERDNIRERSKSGKIDRLQNGMIEYTDKAPYGYRLVNKKLVIFEEEASVVRAIYDEYNKGLSQTELASIHEMHQSHIARILSNPVYCGKPFSKMINKEFKAPQIVSVEDYTKAREKCAQRMIKRARKRYVNCSLRCKIYCEHCNHVLSKKGESWGCHCAKSSIQEKFINKANEMVIEEFSKSEMQVEKTDNLKKKVEMYNERMRSCRKLMYVNNKKLEIIRHKVEVLKGVFSVDELKTEINELNQLEKKKNDLDKELVHIKLERMKVESALKQGMSLTFIDDIVERVNLHIIDRSSKSLEYYMIDGTRYIVTVRTRKNEYTIKKRES